MHDHTPFLKFLMTILLTERHSSVGVSYKLELCIRKTDITWNSPFTFTQLASQMEAYIMIKTRALATSCKESLKSISLYLCVGPIS